MNIRSGDILIDNRNGDLYYVTYIVYENIDISDTNKLTCLLSEHGICYGESLALVKRFLKPTGDRVPFEDIAAILFPKEE